MDFLIKCGPPNFQSGNRETLENRTIFTPCFFAVFLISYVKMSLHFFRKLSKKVFSEIPRDQNFGKMSMSCVNLRDFGVVKRVQFSTKIMETCAFDPHFSRKLPKIDDFWVLRPLERLYRPPAPRFPGCRHTFRRRRARRVSPEKKLCILQITEIIVTQVVVAKVIVWHITQKVFSKKCQNRQF